MILVRFDEVLVSPGLSLLWNQASKSISHTISTYVPVYKIKKLKAHSKLHKECISKYLNTYYLLFVSNGNEGNFDDNRDRKILMGNIQQHLVVQLYGYSEFCPGLCGTAESVPSMDGN